MVLSVKQLAVVFIKKNSIDSLFFSWFIACNFFFYFFNIFLFVEHLEHFLETRLLNWEILEGYTPLFLK